MKIKQEILQSMQTNKGDDVYHLSFKKNVLIVFLRHFGCIFCREALGEIKDLKNKLKDRPVDIVLVHMSSNEIAEKYFRRYELDELARVSDPSCIFYKEFNLLKGTFNQLFGFRSWIRGIDAGIVKGHGWGIQLGDGFQMPGVFSIHNGEIITEFRHKTISDKPDYTKMTQC